MNKWITAASAAIVLLVAWPASAEFYMGASIGNTFVGEEVEDISNQIQKIDENSTGFKFFAGNAPNSFLGIEGGYRNLGKVDGAVSGQTFSSKTTGWDLEALGRLKIAFLDVFGKVGGFFWKTDTFVDNIGNKDDGLALLWGLGAGVRLGPLGIRLEWESMEVKSPENLSLVSLGVTLGF